LKFAMQACVEQKPPLDELDPHADAPMAMTAHAAATPSHFIVIPSIGIFA
jgi:hypothetical protein